MIIALLIGLLAFGGWRVYSLKKQVDEVNKWRSVVEKAVEENNIPQYKEVVLAIILTETKGKHVDLMQSSESKYGESDKVSTSKESIDTGVKFLADAVQKADKEGVDFWSAVQAYNFGLSYIDYVSKNGNKNSLKLAESYSKNKLAPLLGNTTKEKYRYWHIEAILYNGGYIYKDGGNLFYAKMVENNVKLIQFFSS